MLDPRVESNAERIKELEFKLKALSNFIYKHHHNLWVFEGLDDDYGREEEVGTAFIWVETPEGRKKEPSDEV